MAPRTCGEGRPAELLKAASGNSRGPTAWCSLRYRKVTAALAMLGSSPRVHGSGPARGMPFVRCAHVPVASIKDFSFLDLPACFFRSREVKKLLGPLWA